MGLLSALTGSVFDPLVDKATSEENTSEDWALIMDICDRVTVESTGAKECYRSVIRRLNSPIPGVVMQSLTLTDALVSNCGKKFHLEVCSREFETELRRLISSKSHPKVSERARLLIKKWAKEFKNDPQLSLMPSLYLKLKSEGVSFNSSEPKRTRAIDPAVLKNPDVVTSAQEEDDIAKAIEMSLRETQKTGSKSLYTSTTSGGTSSTNKSSYSNQNGAINNSTPLYPSFNLADSSASGMNNKSSSQPVQQPAKDPVKVRALYDFEAAEDNELTFKTGEIILVLDNSDANWWKGSNHRGEGLFPANFVTTDLNAEPEPIYKPEKKVQFNEEIKVKVLESDSQPETNGIVPVTEIDESRIDRLLHLLHEADPQAEKCDSEELLSLEEQCVAMMPLIDQQIEMIDKRHASLTTLNQQLSSALNLYHDLMKESMMMDQAAAAAAAAYAAQVSAMMPPQGMQMMPPGSYTGYSHPGMAPHIAQPPPYDPNSQMAQQVQNGPYNPNQQYYPQHTTVGYQQHQQPTQQMTYANDGTQQPNPAMTSIAPQQPPISQQPQQPVATMAQQPTTTGPYQPMYQSPSHPSTVAHGQTPQSAAVHAAIAQQQQQQYQQSPVANVHYSNPAQYSTPEHQQQQPMAMPSMVTPTMMQSHHQQPPVHHQHQMMTSPPHHMMLPQGSPNSGMPMGGVPVSAVPNIL